MEVVLPVLIDNLPDLPTLLVPVRRLASPVSKEELLDNERAAFPAKALELPLDNKTLPPAFSRLDPALNVTSPPASFSVEETDTSIDPPKLALPGCI